MRREPALAALAPLIPARAAAPVTAPIADSARHLLLRQDAREDLWQASFVEGVSLDALRAGVPMDAPSAPARVTVAPSDAPRSDFLELPCPVVSDAMRGVLDRAGVDNVQYFPAHVHLQYADDDAPVAEYWIANVIGAVACALALPAGASATPPAGAPARVFRIDPERARGFDLFRLAEDRRVLVVSERVAWALHAAELTGIVLQAPETYTGRPVSASRVAAERAGTLRAG